MPVAFLRVVQNWCYDEKTVYDAGLAVHYETGEPLPRELFAKLKEQQQYQAGMVMLRQLYFGKLDMELKQLELKVLIK